MNGRLQKFTISKNNALAVCQTFNTMQVDYSAIFSPDNIKETVDVITDNQDISLTGSNHPISHQMLLFERDGMLYVDYILAQ